MRTHIRKWGNSLALRIPHQVAADLGVTSDTEVELDIVDGSIRIRPIAGTQYALADLLEQVTEENRHDEAWSEQPRGREAW